MNTPIIEAPKKETTRTAKTLETGQTPEQEDDSVFAGKRHFPIFPTNLFEFELTEEDLKKFSNCLPVIHERGNADEPNWVTQPNLNTLDEFKEAVSLLQESVNEVLGFSGVLFDDMLITSLRGHRYTEPKLTSMEIRPNNLLSGLIVLKTDGAGRVTFFDPRPQAWIIKPPISQAHIFNSDAFSVEFKLNKLFIFPAWLQYQVAFKEDKEKKMEENIYLTWNAMVRGGSKPESG